MRSSNLPRILLCTLCLLPALAACAKQWSPEYEKRVGSEATVEVEKKYKLVADAPESKLLAEIVDAVAAVSGRPEVKYQVKVVDTKEVNAFSLPGGYIYVTKGLLADVQSNDELAGVLAHEITHNTFYDALERAEKSKKIFMGSLAAALGALIVGAKSDQVSAALVAGEYIRLGVLSKYSMEVETRADHYAVLYLIATRKYNPVGMLTFMERLAAEERHKPKQELGVYADHPDTDVRCRQLIELLEDQNVDVNRRAVTKWDPAKAEEKDVGGKKVPVVSLWGVDLLQVAAAGEAKAPLERAQGIATVLTKSLAAGLSAYEVTCDTKSAAPRVLVGSTVLVTVLPEDAQAAGVSPADYARQIAANLGAALHKENLGRLW